MKSMKRFSRSFVNKLKTIDDRVRYFILLIYVKYIMETELMKDRLGKYVYDADKKMRD